VNGTRDAGVPEALDKILKKAIEQARIKHVAASAAVNGAAPSLQSSVITLPILADAWQNTVNTVMGALLRRHQQQQQQIQLQRQQQQQQLQQQHQQRASISSTSMSSMHAHSGHVSSNAMSVDGPPSITGHHGGGGSITSGHYSQGSNSGSGSIGGGVSSGGVPSSSAHAMLAPMLAMTPQQRHEVLAAARPHIRQQQQQHGQSQAQAQAHATMQYQQQHQLQQQQQHHRTGQVPPPPPPPAPHHDWQPMDQSH
jgi:sortase (surface protein transpeptidase)